MALILLVLQNHRLGLKGAEDTSAGHTQDWSPLSAWPKLLSVFEIRSYIAQADLELLMLQLRSLPECLDYSPSAENCLEVRFSLARHVGSCT